MKITTNVAAIVSGGASGMGAETARMLAKAGAKVAVFDLNEQAAKAVARDISGIACACDVRSEESVLQALNAANEAHGKPRILINCAGIAPAKRVLGRAGPLPLEEFKQVIDVNLIGTFNVLRLTAADMMTLSPITESGERGVIINTASIAAYEGQIGQAAYSASKGGITSMTLPLAREFSQFGIRVLTIAPGIMDTPMMAAMPSDVRESLANQIPFPKRFGSAAEYASLALHLIENEMMNGTVVRLDGAIRMQPK